MTASLRISLWIFHLQFDLPAARSFGQEIKLHPFVSKPSWCERSTTLGPNLWQRRSTQKVGFWLWVYFHFCRYPYTFCRWQKWTLLFTLALDYLCFLKIFVYSLSITHVILLRSLPACISRAIHIFTTWIHTVTVKYCAWHGWTGITAVAGLRQCYRADLEQKRRATAWW